MTNQKSLFPSGTKVCPCCGIEKPATSFYYNATVPNSKLSDFCRSCAIKAGRAKKIVSMTASASNPDLASFTPRHLIAELRARGYRGQLEYTYKITL